MDSNLIAGKDWYLEYKELSTFNSENKLPAIQLAYGQGDYKEIFHRELI